MRPPVSVRLLLLVLGSLVLGLATVPVMKLGVEAALPGPAFLEDLVRYEAAGPGPATWDVGRVSRRWLALLLLAGFVAARRWIPWRDLARRGLRAERRGPALRYGVGAGLAAGAVYVALVAVSGHVGFTLPPAAYVARKVVEYALGAAVIGLVEELFFRGILFRAMLRDWGVCTAVVASSAVFAVLHAISGGLRVEAGWRPLLGVRLLETYYTVDGSPWPDVRLMIGLFLLGALLCVLYLRTGSLWAPIGFHAAIVWVTKLSKPVLPRDPGFPEWLLGDPLFLVSGVAVWALLLAGFVLLPATAPPGPLGRRLRGRSTAATARSRP